MYLRGQTFPTRVGNVIPAACPLLVVVESEQEWMMARGQLRVVGYVVGDMLRDAGVPIEPVGQVRATGWSIEGQPRAPGEVDPVTIMRSDGDACKSGFAHHQGFDLV